MEALGDFLDRSIDDLLWMGTRLGDLLAIQHGACHLLRKGQADEGPTKPDNKGPDKQLLTEHPTHVDAEHRQDEINQDVDRKREREINENVRNEKQTYTFNPLHRDPPSQRSVGPSYRATSWSTSLYKPAHIGFYNNASSGKVKVPKVPEIPRRH